MPESDRPLLKHGQVNLTAPSDYVDLLEVGCNLNRILCLRDIIIEVETTTVNPVFNISINGKPYVTNARILGSSCVWVWVWGQSFIPKASSFQVEFKARTRAKIRLGTRLEHFLWNKLMGKAVFSQLARVLKNPSDISLNVSMVSSETLGITPTSPPVI